MKTRMIDGKNYNVISYKGIIVAYVEVNFYNELIKNKTVVNILRLLSIKY